jgi:hypothetical protein
MIKKLDVGVGDDWRNLGQVREGKAELRFTNQDGQTEVWLFGLNDHDTKWFKSKTTEAYIDDGVDARLGLQANAIGRLTKHLAWHHGELNMVEAESCTYMKRAWSGFAPEEEQDGNSNVQAD